MVRYTAASFIANLLLIAGAAYGQVDDKKTLTLDGARRVMDAARSEASRLGAPGGAIAVVDDGGHLLALERLDGTFAAAANVSIGKARTAALFKKPTKVFEDLVNNGRTTMVTIPDFTPLQGGVPIVVNGEVVGAIGVSGAASAAQDEELAWAGARAFESDPSTLSTASDSASPQPSPLAYFNRKQVADAFAKGMPLLEVPGYKIHASRREMPGVAEVHETETDVVYVLEGAATLVTGGQVVEPAVTEPGQIRGPRIDGGESRRIGPGDVIVVPQGVPHWFKEVDGPLLYFVVKPIASTGVEK
jgi:glc operon protein GlcG